MLKPGGEWETDSGPERSPKLNWRHLAQRPKSANPRTAGVDGQRQGGRSVTRYLQMVTVARLEDHRRKITAE